MQIDTGLFNNMVLQRTSKNVSDAAFTGSSAATGEVVARVLKGKRVAKGFDGVVVGQASDGRITGRLVGIPVGGPYDVELGVRGGDGKATDKLKVKNILVGDVWVAAGQSNMQGCGRHHQRAKPHPQVRAFYMDDHWAIAEDPIHQLEVAVDEVHNGGKRAPAPTKNPLGGVGPAVSFAQVMLKKTKVPQGILACAHGGTSMAQWDPAKRDEGGKSLYGASVRRIKKNGGRVAGVIWYQGESDANADAARVYTERMKTLIASFRRDANDESLPFVLVQISRVVGQSIAYCPWNSIQDQQRLLPRKVARVLTVPAIDLELDDGIHIAGHANHRLGRRLAEAMLTLTQGKKAGLPPIELKSVGLVIDPRFARYDIKVDFTNVVGSLRSGSRPVGFAVADHAPSGALFDTVIQGKSVILRTSLNSDSLAGKSVFYGIGTDPVCNVVDEADRSLPVFGPVGIGDPRALTPFVQDIRITPPLDGAGDLAGVSYPADVAALPFSRRQFPNRFIDLHTELSQYYPKDQLIWFACKLEVPEAMKLTINLGYDGPTKVWLDRKEVFHDAKGTNPAWEDKARIKIDGKPGEHEVLIALGTNNCKAWGIFLRFERTDLSKEQLEAGPESYAMATVKAE